MICRGFRRPRVRADLALMLSVQRRTIRSMAGRLDLVQRDADMALSALTDLESRVADLEGRIYGSPAGPCPPQ